MRVYHVVSLMTTVVSLASSQQIIPTTSSSTFPGCALACPSLLKAQTACTPPNVTQSTQISYDVCFCKAPDTQALWYTPDGICMDQCGIASDRQTLQTWFMDFCRMVGRGVDPATATASEATSSSSSSASTTTATATSSGAVLSGSASESTSTSTGSAWLSSHWKWIIMIVVLFVGFSGLALLGLWLKKRHRRKAEQEKAARSALATVDDKEKGVERAGSATPDIWGPHQHMQATQGYQYSHNGTPTIVVDDVNSTTKSGSKKAADNVKVSEVGDRSAGS